MGTIHDAAPVKLFCGIIAADAAQAQAAVACLEHAFGPVDAASELIPFTFTDYYAAEMGSPLVRRFVAFEQPVDPGRLADIKRQTNALEREFMTEDRTSGERGRHVNLDPGYITAAKIVLATTKDFSHRLYLGRGIYAEVTANFSSRGLVFNPWTYPDFRSPAYADFFLNLRQRFIRDAARHGRET